jgi:uncharacterized coiled-coil protein SlyX
MATTGTVAQTADQDQTMTDLQRQILEMRSQMVKMQNRIDELESRSRIKEASSTAGPIVLHGQTPSAEAAYSQAQETKVPQESTSIHFKGLTLTPGGFLEATLLVRTRNENEDIANNYSAIPLNGSSNARLSEFRGTSRNSELSLLVQGSAGNGREHKPERLCRSRFSRCSTYCQLC